MKSKILLMFICLMLLMQSIPAQVTYYPPAASWQQGYWDTTSGSSASKTDTNMYFDIEGGAGDGDELYYVSTLPIDLRNTSYLQVTWKGNFEAVDGACVFGIGTVQADRFFTANTTKTTTFTTTDTKLNVGAYYGDYYLKIGGYASSAGIADDINLWVYNITAFNESYSWPLNTSNIEENSATLNGYLVNDSNISCTCGFWLGNVTPVTEANLELNITCSSTYTAGAFSETTTLLNDSEYYYVKSWSYNGYNFNVSTNETYFLTMPTAPTGLTATCNGPQSMYLTWSNCTVPIGTNQSTLIHYSTSSVPASPTPSTWGTYGANESTNQFTTITGLAEETTYNFVAWTWINSSGSPEFWYYSSEYATTSRATEGGVYNISVRYENESIIGNLPVDLSVGDPHKLLIHYADGTDFVEFFNGNHISTVPGYFASNASGNFSVFLNGTVLYMEFRWNDSSTNAFRCNRIIIPSSDQRNITFYIRTDLPVYGETISKEIHQDSEAVANPANPLVITTTYDLDEVYAVYVYNVSYYGTWVTVPNNNYTVGVNQVTIDAYVLDANTTIGKVEYYTYKVAAGVETMEDSLVVYTYSFKDPSTIFVNSPVIDTYIDIYIYNSTGTRLTIDRQYWSANDEIYVYLVYGKKYFMGIGCTELEIDRIGIAPTGNEIKPEAILIPQVENISYAFFEVINIKMGWTAPPTGLWLYYQNTMFSTNSVTFKVFHLYNDTLVYSDSTTQNTKNFTYAAANQSYDYRLVLEVNSSTWSTNMTIDPVIYGGMTIVMDVTSLEDLLNKILGNTPFKNLDPSDARYGESVLWSYTLVGFIAVILLVSFGYVNAQLGMLAVGSWFSVAFAIIEGLPGIFLIGGVFLIAMAILFSMGNRR